MLNKININPTRQILIIYIVLTVVTLAVFWQMNQFDFINFDDDVYVTSNSHVQSGITLDGFCWAFSTIYAEFWHPLTWLSLMFDYHIYGLRAGGYHLTNLILHIMSTLLLFWLFNRMTGAIWRSAFVAALFALHPLHVESVAWVSERKDVLSGFFWMLTLCLYAYYTEKPIIKRYLLVLFSFVCALMSKPMVVTLPFVLMLLDYWPLGRWQKAISAPVKSRCHLIGRLLWEKAPYIFLTIITSIVTFWAQNKSHMIISMKHLPFLVRIQNALIYYVSYLGKIFYPIDLVFFYPYEYFSPLWQILASCFILTVITIVVIYALKKIPFLFLGWFWYLGTLIPVIGLVKSTDYAMADRFTYLPSIGIAIMVAWGIPLLFPHGDIRKKILFPSGIAILAILTVLTWQQCGYWKKSITLFNHALQVTKYNYMAYNGRGIAYGELRQYQLALEDFNQSIRLKPDYAYAYYNRGTIYNKFGQYQQALEDYNKAISLKPDYADAYNNRGMAYGELRQYQLAFEDFNQSIRLNPDYAYAYYNRGTIYNKFGQYQQAIDDHNQAIRLKPYFADAYNNRGIAYLLQGNKEQGCRDAQKACALGFCKTIETAKSKGYCR